MRVCLDAETRMKQIEAKVKLAKKIINAMSEAKKHNVPEPDKKIIEILNANIKWKAFKSQYGLR